MLIGKEGVERLERARVAVFGVGGVGGYAVEALARAGVGSLLLIDSDTVSESNINRQIIAAESTVGRYKTEVARDRILDINPDARVDTVNVFFSEENKGAVDLDGVDYVIDAIDSVSAKVFLISHVKGKGIPIISAMGAGNKLDPTMFEVSDISKTTVCPLARAVRVALRKKGMDHLKVVYSKEEPHTSGGERLPASISFVPSVMGLIIAGEVIKSLSGISVDKK